MDLTKRLLESPGTLSIADTLRALVMTVINDAAAPTAVRNQCHRLMFAIEKNNQALIEESLILLEQAAVHAGYPLPPSNILDHARST